MQLSKAPQYTYTRTSVGFERLFDQLEAQFTNSSQGYPHYNIIQTSEDTYLISLAVAGFTMSDLEIVKEGKVLTISGAQPEIGDIEYLHKGIASRNFRKDFTLAEHVSVEEASLDLGMLNISLRMIIPEDLKPTTIDIKTIR